MDQPFNPQPNPPKLLTGLTRPKVVPLFQRPAPEVDNLRMLQVIDSIREQVVAGRINGIAIAGIFVSGESLSSIAWDSRGVNMGLMTGALARLTQQAIAIQPAYSFVPEPSPPTG